MNTKSMLNCPSQQLTFFQTKCKLRQNQWRFLAVRRSSQVIILAFPARCSTVEYLKYQCCQARLYALRVCHALPLHAVQPVLTVSYLDCVLALQRDSSVQLAPGHVWDMWSGMQGLEPTAVAVIGLVLPYVHLKQKNASETLSWKQKDCKYGYKC